MCVQEEQRERDREDPKWEGQREWLRENPRRVCAVSQEPEVGLEPTNHEIMT